MSRCLFAFLSHVVSSVSEVPSGHHANGISQKAIQSGGFLLRRSQLEAEQQPGNVPLMFWTKDLQEKVKSRCRGVWEHKFIHVKMHKMTPSLHSSDGLQQRRLTKASLTRCKNHQRRQAMTRGRSPCCLSDERTVSVRWGEEGRRGEVQCGWGWTEVGGRR